MELHLRGQIMTIYDKFTTSTKEALAKWITEFANHDDSPWMNWFNKKYCQKCKSEIVTREDSLDKLGFELIFVNSVECSYCEVYNECRYFPNKPNPTIEEIIKMWLDQEVE